MPLCQLTTRSDALIYAEMPAANDNYPTPYISMESFETGSILAQRDYTGPSKGGQIGPIVAAVLCVLALAVFLLQLAA